LLLFQGFALHFHLSENIKEAGCRFNPAPSS